MSAAARRPGDFTPDGYRDLLRTALRNDYRVTGFRDFVPPDGATPVLLLRHDVDHSVRAAAALAELEASLGVQATYFIQVACPFYNLLSPETRTLLRRIVDLGHEIGLHYDANHYPEPDGHARLHSDLRLLEDLANAPVESASQHIPIDSPAIDLSAVVPREAYADAYTRPPMTYVSDSLMAWRQHHPLDLIEQRRSMQLLIHPLTWAGPVHDMTHALRLACEAECSFLRSSYEAVEQRYAELLRNRSELDAAFRARRELPAAGHAS